MHSDRNFGYHDTFISIQGEIISTIGNPVDGGGVHVSISGGWSLSEMEMMQ